MVHSPVAHGAGNVNMKGKKRKVMNCRCCVCMDFRDRELAKEHKKEIKEYISDSSNGRTKDSDSFNCGSNP
jgi:hypothetical protein